MTQSRLKSLSVAVDAAGLKYELFADGIMVDTNYDGPYAPLENNSHSGRFCPAIFKKNMS